jgi:hypothetical protein
MPYTSSGDRSHNRPHSTLLIALAAGALLSGTAKAAPNDQLQHSLSGRVIDDRGKPVANAVVCAAFPQIPRKEQEPMFLEQPTDASGFFRLNWRAALVPKSIRLFVTCQPHFSTDSVVVFGAAFPEVLSATDSRYAGREVDLTRGPDYDLGDVPVQIRFGLLVVRLAGAKVQVDPDHPSEETGLNVQIRNTIGDVVGGQYIPSEAVRENGRAFALNLPEGRWVIEVAKDQDNVWHSLAEPVSVSADGESVSRPLNMSEKTPDAPHSAVPADAASARHELERLGVESSEHSLILHVQAHSDFVVSLLMAAGVNANAKDPWSDETPLIMAAGHRDLRVARVLVEGGADVNAVVPELDGATALQTAVLNSHEDNRMVRLLLDAGANPNVVSKVSGKNLLIYACEASTVETVKLLLAAGANPNHVAVNGVTPLFMAEFLGEADIAEVLKRAGAKR